jgi:hypothetical protein
MIGKKECIDNEKYIDLEKLIDNNKYIYYQLQLSCENLIIKKVGTGTKMGDILIKENFGKNNNYTIYSCIYEKNDFDIIKKKYIPLIKITDNIRIYSIGIMLNEEIKEDVIIKNFDVYAVHGCKIFKMIKLNKDITKENIIEKLIDKLFDINILIL